MPGEECKHECSRIRRGSCVDAKKFFEVFPSGMLALFRSAYSLPSAPMGVPATVAAAGIQVRGVKRVRQKRRTMGKLIQLKQSHYFPKPEEDTPIPKSVLGSGYIRRLLKAGTTSSMNLIPSVAWGKFICTTKGVRWHPCGAWRVQFSRRNLEHNYHVGVDCYFYTKLHGFHRAMELAIAYRKRLEQEWAEAEEGWRKIDEERAGKREAAQKERELVARLAGEQKRIEASPQVDLS